MNDSEAYRELTEILAREAGEQILEMQSDETREKVRVLLNIIGVELTLVKKDIWKK